MTNNRREQDPTAKIQKEIKGTHAHLDVGRRRCGAGPRRDGRDDEHARPGGDGFGVRNTPDCPALWQAAHAYYALKDVSCSGATIADMQSHATDCFLGAGMSTLPRPNITYAP
ncbi:hypothetical protein ACFZDK_11965 [Streptomyces sp. NPDC007901]|uniref:hypothetical protein n=1 Tax=Streptomyces sp. NPDC007901 TaxID=3364785 RepID=UPI0036EE77D1